jgi:hypothetical protein
VKITKDTSFFLLKVGNKKAFANVFDRFNSIDIPLDSTSFSGFIKVPLQKISDKKNYIRRFKNDQSIVYSSFLFVIGGSPAIETENILVRLKAGVVLDNLISKLNLHEKIQSVSSGYDYLVLKINSGFSPLDLSNQIYESGLVDWSHPDFYLPIVKNSNDPLFFQQFYLKNTGQGNGVSGIDMNIESAWNITKGSSNIKIAVIDDGVEDHEDYFGRVLNGFTPRDPFNGNGRPVSNYSHGTACAGIIAATHDNNLGIAGIAPNCKIVPINIFTDLTETTSDVASGINWAWNQGGADVISNSWSYPTTNQTLAGFDVIVQAINNARLLGRNGKGAVVVFSSGNSSSGVQFPANLDNVLTVGAIQKNGNLWPYSSFGTEMDVVAVSGNTNLNGDIVTTDRMGLYGYDISNYTSQFGGTSASCPQASGLASLILSVNPNLTELQVRSIIKNTATDMGVPGFDNYFGNGRLNATLALCNTILPQLSITSSNNGSVCNSSTYTINAPQGSSISWSVDFPSIASLVSNGNSAQITRISNGRINLTATLASGCSISRKIGIGLPDISLRYPRQNPRISPINYTNYNYATKYTIFTDPMPGSVQTWTVSTDDPSFSWGFGQDNKLWFYFSNIGYTATFSGVENNSCGSSTGYIYCKSVSSGGELGGVPLINLTEQIGVYPNPFQSQIKVSSLSGMAINKIQVYDKTGILKYESQYNSNNTEVLLHLIDLKTDVYTIYIYSGANIITKQVLKL